VSKAICTTIVENAFDMNVSTFRIVVAQVCRTTGTRCRRSPPSKLGMLPSKFSERAAEEVDFVLVLAAVPAPSAARWPGFRPSLKLKASVSLRREELVGYAQWSRNRRSLDFRATVDAL